MRMETARLIATVIESRTGKTLKSLAGDKLAASAKPTDVNGDDNLSLIRCLNALGIINGVKTNGSTFTFDPNGTLTRAQLAAIIQRTGKLLGMADATGTAFADVTANWQKPGIKFCSGHGIMNGTGKGKFNPNGTLTRQEAIVTVWRFYGKLDK